MTIDAHSLRTLTAALLFALACSLAAVAHAQNATTPGEITTPHPTLEHISIEWAISDDDAAS